MKTIAMQVNQANLIKSLALSFTNKTTLLGELIQNARRAHATCVNIEFTEATGVLTVIDNGCGISSIETLLTVAESGWDADVVAQEHPFGIGFLSALFACRRITVASKGGCFTADTDDILSFKQVVIKPVPQWDGITTIRMDGVGLDLKLVEQKLTRLAEAFPIPVILNGESLKRQNALDSGRHFIGTEIGEICLSCFNQVVLSCSTALVVYLQGLPIYQTHQQVTDQMFVVHLDSKQFFARLPDRDKLIDEADVIKRVYAVLTQEIGKELLRLKACLAAEDFIKYFGVMKQWQLKHLLNDVPLVPCEVLTVIGDYPNCNTDAFGDFKSRIDTPVSQAAIEQGREVVIFDEYMQDEGAALSMFAWKRGCLIYNGGLDEGHWLLQYVRNLDKEKISVEWLGESHRAVFDGDWLSTTAVFCESYKIQVGADVVEINEESMNDGHLAIVPKGDASGYVITQLASYTGEYDDFETTAYENDRHAFSQFVIANTSPDPCDAFKRLLPGFGSCPSLHGKQFVVSLDEKGHAHNVALA